MAKVFSGLSRKKLEEMCEGLRVLAGERARTIETQKNHIAFLTENAKKWTKRFSDPRYRIPGKIIRQMEQETAQYKERTEAEIVRLRSQKAELVTRIVEIQSDREDTFGAPEGSEGATFEFAESHSTSVINSKDRRIVDAEISLAKKRLEKEKQSESSVRKSRKKPETK